MVLLALTSLLPAQEQASFEALVAPYLETHCIKCHGPRTQKAELAVHDLGPDLTAGDALTRWEKVREMLVLGLMPPPRRKAPAQRDTDAVLQWVDEALTAVGRPPETDALRLPKLGNRVRHEELFSGEHADEPAFSYPRIWRISPSIYAQMAHDMGIQRLRGFLGQADTLADALTPVGEKSFQDYAFLRADETTLRLLVTASRTVVTQLTEARVVRDRKSGKQRTLRSRQAFRLPFLEAESATPEQLREALEAAFERLLQRPPTAEERDDFGGFLAASVETGGPLLGFQNLLMALLLSPEFLFRMELGRGAEQPDGRRMLAPREIAHALAYALGDRPPDDGLREAVAQGRLQTRDDVEREARRLLALHEQTHVHFTVPMQAAGSKSPAYHPRLLRFFREFFGYHRAPDVFKDEVHSRGHSHAPHDLVEDADRFVLAILDRDEDVFGRLLTSDRYFADYILPQHFRNAIRRAGRKKNGPKDAQGRPQRPYARYTQAYGFDENTLDWDSEQPVPVPHRAGMLTHPAWLVAHSGNFDNDPIRRGKWIRERLLAGNVPDLPIGVEAKLPEDPHRTLRDRMQVTEAEECWRCHKYMNPLGLPFEVFDDFGTFRERIVLVKEQRRRDRVLVEEVTAPVDARGALRGTGDRTLDGEVDGALDLIDRLARSERVRQSIVRHAFRYWMGRNERLSDSSTLLAMDQRYVESGGSFRELLVALFTSDSFLMRKAREEAPR